ncbi:oligosaccharide flippase family protein [Marivirga sp.]|uniref:oligosaccharide flippase family protein n=1 Tax=Marivirga sp. TaxID=2018662 RepID=UPI003DA71056
MKSGFFTISQRLSVPLFGVGSFLIIIRSLSEYEMGAWALFLNMVTTLEVARNGLIKGAIVRFYNSEEKSQHESIRASSLLINTIYTIITTSLLIIFASTIANALNTPLLTDMLYLYTISAIFMIPFSHFEYIQQSNMNFKGVFYGYLTKQGLFFLTILTTIILLDINVNPRHLVVAQAFGILIGTIISFKFARKYLSMTLKIKKEWVKKQWSFGKYGFLTNVSNSGLTTTDHLLIGGIVSTASVAVYNAASRITNIFIIPSVAIADILYPKSVDAQSKSGNDAVRILYEKAVGATLVPMIPVILIIWAFPELIIEILAGSKYLDSINVLKVAILSIVLLPFMKQFGTMMNTLEKPHFNFYFVLSLSIFNLLMNYLFISNIGILGAAYATLLSYFIGFIASQIILKRMINSSIKRIVFNTFLFYKDIFNLLSKIKNK